MNLRVWQDRDWQGDFGGNIISSIVEIELENGETQERKLDIKVLESGIDGIIEEFDGQFSQKNQFLKDPSNIWFLDDEGKPDLTRVNEFRIYQKVKATDENDTQSEAGAGSRGGKKRRRRRRALSKSRTLARELKESLDKGEISHEEAFEDLFEALNTTSKEKQQRDDSLKEQQRDGSLKEMVVKSGVFEKAIESGDRVRHVGNAIGRAAGVRSWRSVFGVGKRVKLADYFNHVEPGLVRFRQGEDGDWYASQPDAANEEE
jgi:hypothetical protein